MSACAELIAAVKTAARMDWITEVSQASDVSANRAFRDAEFRCELLCLPSGARLQESEELEDSLCCIRHCSIVLHTADKSCPEGILGYRCHRSTERKPDVLPTQGQ